ARTVRPSCGVNRISRFCILKLAHWMLAPWSFNVKYQWPEEGRRKFDISPCTQTSRKRPSSRVLICAFSSETESARRGLVNRSNRLDWLMFAYSQFLTESAPPPVLAGYQAGRVELRVTTDLSSPNHTGSPVSSKVQLSPTVQDGPGVRSSILLRTQAC